MQKWTNQNHHPKQAHLKILLTPLPKWRDVLPTHGSTGASLERQHGHRQYRYREQSVLYKHGGKSNECILPLECSGHLI